MNNDATPLGMAELPKENDSYRRGSGAALRENAARLFGSTWTRDAAGGDNFFLAALANPDVYKNRNATGSASEQSEN